MYSLEIKRLLSSVKANLRKYIILSLEQFRVKKVSSYKKNIGCIHRPVGIRYTLNSEYHLAVPIIPNGCISIQDNNHWLPRFLTAWSGSSIMWHDYVSAHGTILNMGQWCNSTTDKNKPYYIIWNWFDSLWIITNMSNISTKKANIKKTNISTKSM